MSATDTRAGDLDTRIQLQEHGTTQDAAGQPVAAWASVATLWASVKFPSSLAHIRAGAERTTTRASVRIRWRAGVHERMRVLLPGDARPYAVQAVLPVGRRQWIDLVCEQTK